VPLRFSRLSIEVRARLIDVAEHPLAEPEDDVPGGVMRILRPILRKSCSSSSSSSRRICRLTADCERRQVLTGRGERPDFRDGPQRFQLSKVHVLLP
jgi:hypothetical protein